MLDRCLLEREALRERCYADMAQWFTQAVGALATMTLGTPFLHAILVHYLAGEEAPATGSPVTGGDPLFGRPETPVMRARFLADWAELERRLAAAGCPDTTGRGPLLLVELREKVDVMRTVMATTHCLPDAPLLALGNCLLYGDVVRDISDHPEMDTPVLRVLLYAFLQRVSYLRVSARLARGELRALFEDLIVPAEPAAAPIRSPPLSSLLALQTDVAEFLSGPR